GGALASITGLDPGMFAAIGMVALLAGAANAPLAASVMAIELFGPGIGPFAAISAIVAFIMSGHRSVYPSQVLGMPKTRSLGLRRGVELGAGARIDPRLARLSRPCTPGVSAPSAPAGPPDEGHRDGGRAEFLGQVGDDTRKARTDL